MPRFLVLTAKLDDSRAFRHSINIGFVIFSIGSEQYGKCLVIHDRFMVAAVSDEFRYFRFSSNICMNVADVFVALDANWSASQDFASDCLLNPLF